MKRLTRARVKAVRRRRRRILYHPPGAPPGTLERAAGEEVAPPARVSLLRYREGSAVEENRDAVLADCKAPAADAPGVLWLHIQGSPNAEQLKVLGDNFALHPLALEDIFNQEGRAKFESYEAQQFVVLNHVHREADGGLRSDPVSFFLGENYLISIDECSRDAFDPVRQRIHGKGKFRARDAGYLLYALMDVVVDGGFPLLEALGNRLEDLEDEILAHANREARNKIYYLRRELMQLRRAWWPQREVIAALMREGGEFLSETTRLYLRDCYDHCVLVVDFVENYREMTSGLLDTYLSAVSQRMNDIMKALTIIATIFLPLSFIVGLYGMNFSPEASHWNMPELHWRFGYFYALGVMLAIVVGMLVWFRHKHWL